MMHVRYILILRHKSSSLYIITLHF